MELLLTDKRKTWVEQILGGRSGVQFCMLSLRCLLGTHMGKKTHTHRLLVMIKYGEYKSLSMVPDIIFCVRSENILLHETRIRSCKGDIQGQRAHRI